MITVIVRCVLVGFCVLVVATCFALIVILPSPMIFAGTFARFTYLTIVTGILAVGVGAIMLILTIIDR